MTEPNDDGRARVEAARAGDEVALESLVRECAPAVRAFLEQRSGPGVRRYLSVSDLLQDVLLRARDLLTRLPDGAGVDDLRALLLQNARWVVLNTARDRRRYQGESVIESRPPDGAPSASAGDVTVADERRWLLGRIDELPEDLAEVVRMRLDDRDFGEIAAALGISRRTAQERFLKAARRLRPRS